MNVNEVEIREMWTIVGMLFTPDSKLSGAEVEPNTSLTVDPGAGGRPFGGS